MQLMKHLSLFLRHVIIGIVGVEDNNIDQKPYGIMNIQIKSVYTNYVPSNPIPIPQMYLQSENIQSEYMSG